MQQAHDLFNPSPKEAESTEETPAEPKTSTFNTNEDFITLDDIKPFDAIGSY